ncbi:hypothetical protein SLA2020_000830 [Shorea laevis]
MLHLDFQSSDHESYILTMEFLCNYNLHSLTVLHLNAVEVTDEVVDYIPSHCPSLELLSVNSITFSKASESFRPLAHAKVPRDNRLSL